MVVYRPWQSGMPVKFGLREKVEFAYFSTIYVLAKSKGSVSEHIPKYSFEIDPDKILDFAQVMHLTPGSSLSVESQAVLVIRGNSKALLVHEVPELETKPIKLSESLTLGGVVKMCGPGGMQHIYATDEVPDPIIGLSGQSWDLVAGAKGVRGWKRKSITLEISAELIALHAFVNNPY